MIHSVTRMALLAALFLALPLHAQTTLTFGGSDAIGSILDRQNLTGLAYVRNLGSLLRPLSISHHGLFPVSRRRRRAWLIVICS